MGITLICNLTICTTLCRNGAVVWVIYNIGSAPYQKTYLKQPAAPDLQSPLRLAITMAPFPSPTSTWHNKTYPSISPTHPNLSNKGKTVVITGGVTGIGAETARYFAEAGATRREQPLLDTKASIEFKSPGTKVLVSSTDVTKKHDEDAAFSSCIGDGEIHIPVSNAAMIGPQSSFRDADGDKFLYAIQQNLKGSLNIAQAFFHHAAPRMQSSLKPTLPLHTSILHPVSPLTALSS